MDGEVLEKIYQENLEERIIFHFAEVKQIPVEKAMDLYYHSRLAGKIYQGIEGIQYLDYKVLVQILMEELCPDGVEYKRLGDIASISRGGNFQKKDFVEKGVPCIHYGQI